MFSNTQAISKSFPISFFFIGLLFISFVIFIYIFHSYIYCTIKQTAFPFFGCFYQYYNIVGIQFHPLRWFCQCCLSAFIGGCDLCIPLASVCFWYILRCLGILSIIIIKRNVPGLSLCFVPFSIIQISFGLFVFCLILVCICSCDY